MNERQHATWEELLRAAIAKPGRVLEAYTAFHNFSGRDPGVDSHLHRAGFSFR